MNDTLITRIWTFENPFMRGTSEYENANLLEYMNCGAECRTLYEETADDRYKHMEDVYNQLANLASTSMRYFLVLEDDTADKFARFEAYRIHQESARVIYPKLIQAWNNIV